MDSREQFQQWWEKVFEGEPREPWSVLYSPDHDYFLDGDIDGQYDAWKASRAALFVDFPAACAGDEYFIDGVFQPMRYERDVERALKRAGISVKGDV